MKCRDFCSLFLAVLVLTAGCRDDSNPPKNGGPGTTSGGGTKTPATDPGVSASDPGEDVPDKIESDGGEKLVLPSSGKKVLRLPIRTDGPKTLDPVRGSTQYENMVCSQIYQPLLQYDYLVRPLKLKPLLLEKMPEITKGGTVFRFKLREGIKFHDNECFEGGKGREVVSSDVFYSWKRMADDEISKSWWLMEGTIVGFDEYHKEQNLNDSVDYFAPIEGMKIIDDHEFEVTLQKPVTRFLFLMAMFQTAVIPHEAVEHYGTRFSRNPVGTGPFTMKEEDWKTAQSITVNRNPNYFEEFYPVEHMTSDKKFGFEKPAGAKVPISDRIEFTMFVQDQPMWLKFQSKELDFTTVPAEMFDEAFIKRRKRLRQGYRDRGIVDHQVPLLDFIFIGFNMTDSLVGGDSEKAKYLRQAISSAMDWEERNDAFYNGLNVVYDGPIPPQLAGHPEGHNAASSYRGLDLERARELLAKAGYPNGKGLPKLDYYVSRGGNSAEQAEMLQRQLKKIGIEINKNLVEFSTLIEAVDNRKAQVFSFAWGSDYPDAENNLAMFYGPNESPGSNHFNYQDDEYDELYEKILGMQPSDERTQLMVRMRDILLEDAPYMGSMARIRFYLVNPRLKNFKPNETFWDWLKYLDVDESA